MKGTLVIKYLFIVTNDNISSEGNVGIVVTGDFVSE